MPEKQLNMGKEFKIGLPKKICVVKIFWEKGKASRKITPIYFYVGVVKRLCFDDIARNVFVLPNTDLRNCLVRGKPLKPQKN